MHQMQRTWSLHCVNQTRDSPVGPATLGFSLSPQPPALICLQDVCRSNVSRLKFLLQSLSLLAEMSGESWSTITMREEWDGGPNHHQPTLEHLLNLVLGSWSSDLFKALYLGSPLCYGNLASSLAKADIGTQKMSYCGIKFTSHKAGKANFSVPRSS